MKADQPLLSPRLSTLQEALTTGKGTALETFWQEITHQGTPLVEPLPDDPDHLLVTFLWRAREELTTVVVVGGLAPWGDFANHQMSRLLDTDLWYKTYRARNDTRTLYELSPNDSLLDPDLAANWEERILSFQPDPLNPRIETYRVPSREDESQAGGTAETFSVLELPNAPGQPWIKKQLGISTGDLVLHHMRSDHLSNERRIWVYTPPRYDPGKNAYPLLLLFDGLAYTQYVPTSTILDNLVAAELIPPLVAVLPDSLDVETRSRELSCHQPFVDFLTQELVPWIHQRYHATSNPAQTIVGGSSFGGLAAVFAALCAPHLFGKVLSQSGSFWWSPETDPEPEWLARQFITAPKLPLRFYLEVGLLERSIHADQDQLSANRHLRNILHAREYEVHYEEYCGGHAYLCWRGSLAQGIVHLLQER